MPEHPLKIYEDLDPKLLDLVNNTQKLAWILTPLCIV